MLCSDCMLLSSMEQRSPLAFSSPSLRPAAGFDAPAVHSSPLSPSSRHLGSLPSQHLVVNLHFPAMNLWSFSSITTRHSGSLRHQLGCISLDAVHLMYLMFTLRLSSQLPEAVFVLSYQTQKEVIVKVMIKIFRFCVA